MHSSPRRSRTPGALLASLLLVAGALAAPPPDGNDGTPSDAVPGRASPPQSCRAIQAAIDALPEGGGQVIVRAGTYVCDQPIVIDRDNVDLRGEGPATVLKLADDANAPVLVLGEAAYKPAHGRQRIRVSDLVIDGNRKHQRFECMGGPCQGENTLRNNGISVRRCMDCQVERVTVFGARSGGLVTEHTTRRLRVRDFTAFDNAFDGLAGYETEESTFSGITVHDNLAAGLSFDLRFDNNTIGDAIISRNGSVGIFMRDSANNVFHTIQVLQSGQHGIFLGNRKTPATGNQFSGIAVFASKQAAMKVDDASCVHNFVAASQFDGNAGGCISEAEPGLVTVFGSVCR